jgi:hypothetical protein
VLTRDHLSSYCLPYGGSLRCRYLAEDENRISRFFCLKKSNKKKIVDAELDEIIKTLQNKGKDIGKQGIPLGNNCPGFILLKNKKQGINSND